jgi:hypothetical protein
MGPFSLLLFYMCEHNAQQGVTLHHGYVPVTLHAIKLNGKAIPLQAWTGPEDSRRLRFPDSKIIGTWRW